MADIIDGVTVRMGGADYVVAPLTFRQLRTLKPKIDALGQISGTVSDEQITSIIEIAHAALSRNYPDITQDALEDMIDLLNASKLISAIMGISGLVGKPTGEAAGNP